MEKHNYYEVQHLGTLGCAQHWFRSEPRYYGIEKANYCLTIDDARKLLAEIKGSEKCGERDEFQIVHRIVTEEVIA